MVKHLDWHGLYGDGWKGEIVADAFQHPAKYSRALIRHIYEYLIKEKMVKPGDICIDPFGGVALGGLDAARLGLHFIGCELEPKFVDLGNQNIALWNSRYAGKMPRWGSARLVQGDSRHLRSVIAVAGCVVSSPPYAESIAHDAGGNHKETYVNHYGGGDVPPRCYSDNPANLGNLKGDNFEAAVSSPPYNLPMSQDHNGTRGGKRGTTPAEQGAFVKYGNTDGQIEGLPMSEEGFNAAISSPPYEEARIGQESGQEHCGHNDAYGATPGQMGAMKSGGYDAAVSSPPYEAIRVVNGEAQRGDISTIPEFIDSYGAGSFRRNHDGIDDFWSSARQVVAETHAVLAPGAVAVWVVKDFIRAKTRVPFCDQWRQLCEACGFTTYAIARAWLVEDHGTQLAMDGNHKHKRTERKSFFRRLAEKKGSPRIDFETVLIMVKP